MAMTTIESALIAEHEKLGAETKAEEVRDLRSMNITKMPSKRDELLDDIYVLHAMSLHDGSPKCDAILRRYGDDGPRMVKIAQEAALRGYHAAWGF